MSTTTDPSWAALARDVAAMVAQQLRDDPPAPLSPWLTQEGAADYVRLSPKALEDMRRRGVGPRFHRVHRRLVRYHTDDLDAWLRGHDA